MFWTILNENRVAIGHEDLPEGIRPSSFLCIREKGPLGYQYNDGNWVLYVPQISEEEKSKTVRDKRNEILKNEIDIINPMWWNSMTSEQQQNWQNYRQALLDIPQQQGFPFEIIWPEKPTQ